MQYNRPTINYNLFVRHLIQENRIQQLIKIIDFKKLIINGKSEVMCSIIINFKKKNSAKLKIPHNRTVKNCWRLCYVLQFITFSINNGLLPSYRKQNMLRENQSVWNCMISTAKRFMLTVFHEKLITRARSTTDCPRSSNWSETESFMEAAKPELGCRAKGEKKIQS
jgi:hypothetical protein